jgi:outer membrane protein TolC
MYLMRSFCLLLLACVVPAHAQTVSTNNARPITLAEVVTLALQHNFDVQIQRFDPELARYSLNINYGAYDPVLVLQGLHRYSLSPGGIDEQTRVFQGSETESDEFAGSISGLAPTGLNYQLSARASDQYGTRPDLVTGGRTPFENATANAAAATLTQPLLRNFWIDTPRANIYISKNRLKYSEQALRFRLMQTINAVEQAYYNLIFARENLKVQEAAVLSADRLVQENKKKVEVGAMAPLDERSAEAQASASRAQLIDAQRAVEAQENILKNLITDQYAEWHDVNLIPAENLIAVPEVLNLQQSWQNGMRLRPDLAQARLDLERSEIFMKLDFNQLFPSLDVIGQYGYQGSGNEFSRALGQVKDMDNPFWYYGAQLRYPLGSRIERNNYKTSKVQKKQAELLFKQKEQSVLVEIDDAVKQIRSSFERITATRDARAFAESALDAEQKKLENGKSTSYEVLLKQRDLTAARFDEIQALAQYNIAIAQLAFREGTTLDRHKLNVTVK